MLSYTPQRRRIGGKDDLRFTPEGVLEPGDYEMTLAELKQSMLVVGPGPAYSNWDRAWRSQLVDNPAILVGN